MVKHFSSWIAFGILTLTQVGCETAKPGTPLPSATGVPPQITVAPEQSVKTLPFIDGVVRLPAGVYSLIGENEKGCDSKNVSVMRGDVGKMWNVKRGM